jgi:cytochrome c-type biogenesis protein
MTADVSILAALFAGLISFLSPCVLPLVPPYLAFLAGSSLERLAEAEPAPVVRREVIVAALLFVAGFSTIFVALGAGASVIGSMLRFYSHELSIVAGIVIVVMGLHFLGITPIAFLYRQARIDVQKPVGLAGRPASGRSWPRSWR